MEVSTAQSIIQPKLISRPLGEWVSETHQRWEHYTTPDRLIISTDVNTYVKSSFTRMGNYSLTPKYMTATIPCDVIQSAFDDKLLYIGSGEVTPQLPDVRSRLSHIQSYNEINDWRKHNWGNLRVTKRVIKNCIKQLKSNNLVACCDGSVNYDRSAHAWGLATKTTMNLFVSGCAPVDGHPDVLNSTRAEILGILACVTFLQWISLRENIRHKTILIYTDSEAAIACSTMGGLSSTKYALHTDIDVILEL